jgi:hypothetical protein
MDAKLIVIGGKANKSEVKLKLPTTIGRSRKADLTVAHPKVSRQHCQIFERDGLLVVRDFGSLNGTFIENARVSEAILKPGDKLTVGPLTFVAVYDHDGPLPAAAPDVHNLPTPAIQPVKLPPSMAQAGRGEAVAAGPVQPPPGPLATEPAAPDETGPLEAPQPPTIVADSSEPEADDFSWLGGDTQPAPPAPPAADESPAFAETIDLKQSPSDAEDAPDELPEAEAPADALANPPEGDPQDFSWLDNAKDQPLDFSAFEGSGPAAEATSPSVDSGRTTIANPAVTVAMPKETAQEPPTEPPAAEESFAWLEKAEQAAPPAPFQPAPAEQEPPAPDGLPDFAALEQSSPGESDDDAFPSVVAERPVAKPPAAGGRPSKSADKKAWWPFAGKKQPPGKKSPAPAAPEEPVSSSSEPAAPEQAPAAQSPPPFFVPATEDAPAAESPEPSAPKEGNEDDALGEFFKSLK